jgi:hypothetical protein
MDNTEKDSSNSPDGSGGSRSRVGLGLFWISGALLLYVLSVGPVVIMVRNGTISEPVARTVYAPLRWLDKYTPSEKVLNWYVNLWTGD